MKNINIDDIKVSEKLDEVIKNATAEGYKDIKYKKKKNFRNGAIAAGLGIALLGTVFSTEISANIKLAMFDISKHLGISSNLDEYKTVVNKSITQNGITVQLNEVILDKDELVVSTTIRSDKPISNDSSLNLSGDVYINGKRISSGASGSAKQIDENTQECVMAYKLDDDFTDSNLNIELKYKNAISLSSETGFNIEGPWEFEFIANGDTLAANSQIIKLGNSVVLENGQKVTFNELRSNAVGQKIYYSIENRARKTSYALELKGHDDLGNKIQFYTSYGEKTKGIMKIYPALSPDAKELTLTPYAVEIGKTNVDYEVVGEEFTITLK